MHSAIICYSVAIVVCTSLVVIITTPPENTTVSSGSDVTISCGYWSVRAFPVTWIINGTSFTQQEVVNSPLYQLNNPTNPWIHSLTVFSINDTTTFQCLVHSIPSTTSTLGTVIVTAGKYICKYLIHSNKLLHNGSYCHMVAKDNSFFEWERPCGVPILCQVARATDRGATGVFCPVLGAQGPGKGFYYIFNKKLTIIKD